MEETDHLFSLADFGVFQYNFSVILYTQHPAFSNCHNLACMWFKQYTMSSVNQGNLPLLN